MLDAFIDEAALTRRVWMAYAQLTQDAQSVIAMRLWGQAGGFSRIISHPSSRATVHAPACPPGRMAMTLWASGVSWA
jgi:hypothetical protein